MWTGIGHKIKACEFNAELIVCNINANLTALAVVVLRSNRNSKVPDSLGVNAVDSDLKNIIFICVGNSTVCIMRGCNLIGISVYGNIAACLIGMAERNNTRNVLYRKSTVRGNVFVKNYFLCLCGKFGIESISGSPILKNYIKLACDLIVIDIIYCGFFCSDSGGICRGKRFDGGTVYLAVCTLGIFNLNIAFGIHKAEDLILEFFIFGIGLVNKGFLRAEIVGFQFFLKELQSIFIVGKKVFIGNFVGIIGNSGFISVAY